MPPVAATSAPRTVLYVIPRTDDIRTAIAFVEDKPGSLRTTPGLDKLANNHVEFFPKDPRTVTYLINDQPVRDRDVIISYLRQNSISNVKLIENASQTHRTFVIR